MSKKCLFCVLLKSTMYTIIFKPELSEGRETFKYFYEAGHMQR